MTAYEAARKAIAEHEERCDFCSLHIGKFRCETAARLYRAASRIHRESLCQGGLFQGPLFDGERDHERGTPC